VKVDLLLKKEILPAFTFDIPLPDEARHVDDQGCPWEHFTFTAQIPLRGSSEAAGWDVHAFLPKMKQKTLLPGQIELIPTGLTMAPDAGATILVCPRSGLATKGITVMNAPGIVDSDYRGEICVILANFGKEDFVVQHGMRIAQLLFFDTDGKRSTPEFNVVKALGDLRGTSRGTSGFGSTGL